MDIEFKRLSNVFWKNCKRRYLSQKKNKLKDTDDTKSYLAASQSGPWGPNTSPPIKNTNNTSGNISGLKLLGGITIAFILLLFFLIILKITIIVVKYNTSSTNSQNFENNELCNDNPYKCNKQLCKKATLGDEWETKFFQGHVNLAKQRGLSCGVSSYSANQTNNNPLCYKNLKFVTMKNYVTERH